MASKLQVLAQNRNSSKGRIKGLRNNIRGMINGSPEYLTSHEKEVLGEAEENLDRLLKVWDENWESIKDNL